MSMSVPKPNRKYSYADYLKWPDEERWEIIDGIPYDISPAPSVDHQRISREIFMAFASYLRDGKTCEAFYAPFDVRIPVGDEEDENMREGCH